MYINLDTTVNYQKPAKRMIYLWDKTDCDTKIREISSTYYLETQWTQILITI